jgi:hypothetical protein
LNCLFLCAACARRADQRAGMPGIAYVVAAVQPGGDIASVDAVSTVLVHVLHLHHMDSAPGHEFFLQLVFFGLVALHVLHHDLPSGVYTLFDCPAV